MARRERKPVAVIAEIRASVPSIFRIMRDMAGIIENIPIAKLITNHIAKVEAFIFLFLIR